MVPKEYTANIFVAIFTVFRYVPILKVAVLVSLYGLHLIAAPITVE